MSTRLPLCTGNNNKVLFLAHCVLWQAHFEPLHYLFCLWLSRLWQTSIPQRGASSKKTQSCTFLCLHWLWKSLHTGCIYKNPLFNWMQCFYLGLVRTAYISYHWEIILAKSGFIFSTGKHGFFFFLTCYFLFMPSKIYHKNTLITDLKTNNLQIVIMSLQNTREEWRHQMSVR